MHSNCIKIGLYNALRQFIEKADCPTLGMFYCELPYAFPHNEQGVSMMHGGLQEWGAVDGPISTRVSYTLWGYWKE